MKEGEKLWLTSTAGDKIVLLPKECTSGEISTLSN